MRNNTARKEDSGVHRLQPVKRKREPKPKPKGAPGIVTQIKTAAKASNRLAATAGLLMGGIVPFMVFMVAHYEMTAWLSVHGALVCGGLLFSAITVWQWAKAGFACPWKATGFAILVEGVMVLSTQPLLTQLALAYLIMINGIATGVRFSQQK